MINNYGTRLAEALQIAKKERQELADGIGISVQAIGQVIAGKTKALTAENSALAAQFLGVNSHWLATGIGRPHRSTAAGGKWPFTVEFELFAAMPPEEHTRLDDYVTYTVQKWHQQNAVKSKKAG